MKYSRQREIILNTLKENKVHPTAEQLYEILKAKGENIGIATVYRNLNNLTEMGEIIKFKTFEKNERYDAITLPHNHFQCTECGKIYDLSVEYTNSLIKKITTLGFDITQSLILFSGKCPECRKKENK